MGTGDKVHHNEVCCSSYPINLQEIPRLELTVHLITWLPELVLWGLSKNSCHTDRFTCKLSTTITDITSWSTDTTGLKTNCQKVAALNPHTIPPKCHTNAQVKMELSSTGSHGKYANKKICLHTQRGMCLMGVGKFTLLNPSQHKRRNLTADGYQLEIY